MPAPRLGRATLPTHHIRTLSVPGVKHTGNLPAVVSVAPKVAVATHTTGNQQEKAISETIKYYEFWEDFALVADGEAAQAGHARAVFLNAVQAAFSGRSRPDIRLLDGGCGTGRDIAAFRQLGYVCEGFDPCQRFVEQARARSGCTVHVADFESFNVPARFHGIFCLASLYHVPRERLVAALQNLRRHLKPGGVLLASMPLGHKDHLHPEGVWVNNMPPDEFEYCISAAGFSNPKVYNNFAMYSYGSTVIVARNVHPPTSHASLADGRIPMASIGRPVITHGLGIDVAMSIAKANGESAPAYGGSWLYCCFERTR